MGLFKRFKTVLKANINDMISKAENPEKMLNQMVLDMNEQMIEAKKTVASAIADAGPHRHRHSRRRYSGGYVSRPRYGRRPLDQRRCRRDPAACDRQDG